MKTSTAVFMAGHAGLLVLVMFFIANLPAIEQFSEKQCSQMQKELDDNRDEQRRGYSLKNGDKLKATEQSLAQQIYHHCVKPIAKPTPGTKNRIFPVKRRPYDYYSNIPREIPMSAKQFFVSAVEVRAPYQGRQLAAWLAFYREPKECYGVRQTALIVDCVNRRQQAQRRFEKQWVQQRSQILSDLRSQ